MHDVFVLVEAEQHVLVREKPAVDPLEGCADHVVVTLDVGLDEPEGPAEGPVVPENSDVDELEQLAVMIDRAAHLRKKVR